MTDGDALRIGLGGALIAMWPAISALYERLLTRYDRWCDLRPEDWRVLPKRLREWLHYRPLPKRSREELLALRSVKRRAAAERKERRKAARNARASGATKPAGK